MKKALAIILCVVAVCFASCNKEKPNQKFIGNYNGDVTAEYKLSALGYDLDGDPLETNLTMVISAGQKDDQVVAICTIEDESRTVNGTVTDNFVDFDPLVINEDIEGSQVNITVDLNGTLNDNVMNVTGTLAGSGTIIYEEFPTPIPFTMTGTVNGALNKLVVTE